MASATDSTDQGCRAAFQSLFMLDTDRLGIEPRVRTAVERPLRVYHDWGFYGHASTREAADLRETNRRFHEYLRTTGFEPAGAKHRAASAGQAGAIARIDCARHSSRPEVR